MKDTYKTKILKDPNVNNIRFSWQHARERAIYDEINSCKHRAKEGFDTYKLKHPAEVQKAQSNNYTELINRVTTDHKTKTDAFEARRRKIAGLT